MRPSRPMTQRRKHWSRRKFMRSMRSDPLFVDALDAVRNDPAKNSFVRGQSDRSVAVYDAVKKELEERARTPRLR
jgi:hypothetical protein